MTQKQAPAATHTPTPWKARALKRHIEIFWPETGKKIAEVPLPQFIDQSANCANAVFIVRACNSHDELVALARAVAAHFADTDAPLGEMARAALAKAEGGQP